MRGHKLVGTIYHRSLVTLWDLMSALTTQGTAYVVFDTTHATNIYGILVGVERESGDGTSFNLVINRGYKQERYYWRAMEGVLS